MSRVQVIRLRALKEEMLLRLERRRAVLALQGDRRGTAGLGSGRQRPILPKPTTLNGGQNSVIGEGRQVRYPHLDSVDTQHYTLH